MLYMEQIDLYQEHIFYYMFLRLLHYRQSHRIFRLLYGIHKLFCNLLVLLVFLLSRSIVRFHHNDILDYKLYNNFLRLFPFLHCRNIFRYLYDIRMIFHIIPELLVHHHHRSIVRLGIHKLDYILCYNSLLLFLRLHYHSIFRYLYDMHMMLSFLLLMKLCFR